MPGPSAVDSPLLRTSWNESQSATLRPWLLHSNGPRRICAMSHAGYREHSPPGRRLAGPPFPGRLTSSAISPAPVVAEQHEFPHMMILPELILLTITSVAMPKQPLLNGVDAMVFAPAPIAAAVAPQGRGHGHGQGQGHTQHGQGHGYGHGHGVSGGTPEPGSFLLLAGVLLAYGAFRASSRQPVA